MVNYIKIVWIIIVNIKLTKTNFNTTQIYPIDTIQSYCTSFSSCWDCKRSGNECDWCHDVGCTHYPSLHCPQKVSLDKAYHKNSPSRYCTEIVSGNPIFVPANIMRFIKLNLKIDDLTIYKRNVICELHLEQSIVTLKGSFGDRTVFCDMTTLRIERSITMGYIRLMWGGAEPHSNMVLMVVYKCESMANYCTDCQALDKRFNCGWCEETSSCILMEQCPRQSGQWIDRKTNCIKDNKEIKYNISYFNNNNILKPLL
ncbi:hypothetical protein PYW08_011962 [Mythimna loreyi]|uniref:Uncharacterized protein n=1 Tax=Mythimna loreyi TaxID=667449 RepID=A0ACC2QLZ4_9NEOP|nr:hypothetical protein PYW08_011962 [Mythimna loreyi]